MLDDLYLGVGKDMYIHMLLCGRFTEDVILSNYTWNRRSTFWTYGKFLHENGNIYICWIFMLKKFV